MTIQAVKDRVVLKRIKVEDKTPSGIILSDKPKHHSNYAVVISAGDKVRSVKTGDTVLIGGWNKSDFTFEGEDYIAMTEDDIMAVVRE